MYRPHYYPKVLFETSFDMVNTTFNFVCVCVCTHARVALRLLSQYGD